MSASATTLKLTPGASRYLFHHVFLPPKLPQEDDYSAEYDRVLLDSVIHALHGFRTQVSEQHGVILGPVIAMITRLRETLESNGYVNEVKLRDILEKLNTEGGILPLHIRCQNAAILLTRNYDAIHVETFELSPRNEAVNATKGRLQRQFPGPAFSLDRSIFSEQGMRSTMAQTLAKMSHQSVPGTKEKVKKSGQELDEDRDSTDPKMVTELFTAFLRPCSTIVDNLQIHKNTRDEVLWLDCRSPWQRSALWLLIRVALQLIVRRLCQRERVPDDIYKHFMVYYMSTILNVASAQVSDENCHLMSAKIARRLHKLDLSAHPAWFPYVQHSLQRANSAISDSWRSIVARNTLRHDKLRLVDLDFSKDIYFPLRDLEKWLEGIDNREHCRDYANFQPQRKLLELQNTELPSFAYANDPAYTLPSLAVFENWVDVNLNSWLQLHLSDEDTCQHLGRLIRDYHAVASSLYSHNPEALSVMLLTILELWIACDRSAIEAHPTLSGYSSCVPMDIFESLVLPYRSQMERLARAEEYMHQRQRRLRYPGSCIFQDFGTQSCFSVKYFDQSGEHQALLATIEEHARNKRNAKQAELRKKQQEYKRLIDLADEIDCTFYEVTIDRSWNIKELRHSPSCKKCQYTTDADSISIDIHEWPLPRSSMQAKKTTVFELKIPRPFAFWRDTTIYLLLDVLGVAYSSQEHPRARYQPRTYTGLAPFFTSVNNSQRIGLLSQDKPHERTHRRQKKIIDVTERDVCLENGMNFHYFDDVAGCFVSSFKSTDEITTACMYNVPSSSSSLQQYLFRPAGQKNGPPPNIVIASQDVCPQDMSLEEYKALCSMPLGIHIQWENILRQLAMPSVVFKKVETCIFILQIIFQAGPPTTSSVLRAGHIIMNDDSFVMALLGEIENAAARIKENWESAQELSVLIVLTRRVLSLSGSAQIQDRCLAQLSSLRDISFGWFTLVRDEASNTDSNARRNDLLARSTHLALICVATYDSEGAHLEQILDNDSDASVWIKCCMMIHDRRGLLELAPGSLLSLLYYRWQVLAYRCYRILAHQVVHQKKAVMDLAIQDAWAAYRPGSPWSVAPADYWLFTRDNNLLVHFNLLTGELLVNGRPLARLPAEYERHEAYHTLFGQSPVEVMPSEVAGMHFSGKRKHMSQTIHLGKKPIPGSSHFDLCVRAVSEDQKRICEFLPTRLLAGAFPDAFVEDYAHWYDLDGGFVEFRPVRQPWQSSSSHWRLQRQHPGGNWYLAKGDVSLVSMGSKTAESLSSILSPIERASRLHCKLNTSTSVLDIEIPRLRLSFDLQSGHSSIRSRQYRGMSIDVDQSLGTLIGLRNKLILRHENGHDRKVLIPEGNVTWAKDGNHVAVSISWQEVSNSHVYSVDDQLGRLVDNGSLQSKLILCYLHAVTSFCIPDPLTKKTGTEQSLSILQSASARSFSQLQPENIAILVKIAELTPERSYYPANERVMQSIGWQSDLECLVQYDGFREQVVSILDQDRRMSIFYPDSQRNQPRLPSVNEELLQRACIRSSSFRVTGFGAEDYTATHDRQYSERGRNYQSKECSRVFTLCKTVNEKIPSSSWSISHQDLFSRLWDFFASSDKVHGPQVVVRERNIHYDATWILDPVEFISTHWCGIHHLLCSETSPQKYQVMIWLSALVFSNKIPMSVLEALAALYVIPGMVTLMPPSRDLFQPLQGYEISTFDLNSVIQPTKRQQTPESRLSPLPGEKYRRFQQRIDSIRQSKSAQALNSFIAALHIEWPTLSPSTPSIQGSPLFDDYFDTQRAMVYVREKFSTWFYNKEFRDYLASISSAMSTQGVQLVALPSCPFPSPAQPPRRNSRFCSIDDVLDLSLGPPPALEMEAPVLGDLLHTGPGSVKQEPRLQTLVESLELQAKSVYEKQYVQQLQGSTKSLQDRKQINHVTLGDSELERVTSEYYARCEIHCKEIYNAVLSRLMFSCAATGFAGQRKVYSDILKLLCSANMGPRFSPELLLQQLTRKRWSQLPKEWRDCFIAYGRSITALQWAKRLANLIGHREDLIRELRNPGHTNWDPSEFPESLLIEIENGLLIREVQEQIARRMRSIQPGQNAVMQLNMGEGKSSVIVPIVAAALADGSCLVRVLVAKPQSRQMFQMLVSKLGGLLGRRVYHLPVSRSLKISEEDAVEIERMCLKCRAEGGVLLVQPEHILSLKLMCVECFVAGNDVIGNRLLQTLELFRTSSRDVIDESDENFSAKFELIYTMGSQRALELSPNRWTLIQQLLGLVRKYAPAVKEKLPQSIEVVEHQPGGFPRIRLLHENAAPELFTRIAHHACNNGIDSLSVSWQPEVTRKAVRSYILKLDLSAQEASAVEGSSFWTETTKDLLLLLRGLLAGGVLASCLGQKRWRVNYGPHDSREPPTKLAVPYRAKDNPALRSEFSHPDVVVVLTCLSYYYAGLSDDELFNSFQHLLKSDQADIEYQRWVHDAPNLSHAYCHLGGINLQDRHHCLEHIFPNLRASKGAIDYFLSHLVFPEEMKEFPSKLSASGWDVGEIKSHPTAGFSGTNDSRVTLPLSVDQLDLPEQNHTNALVLEYLLRPENSVVLVPEIVTQVSRSDAQALLDTVVELHPPTRVILDVGAQILELTNLEVSQTWLRMMPNDCLTQAVVFVSDSDEICVVDRTGLVEPLQISPFAEQLEACLVFLDEAHTRGIDLKLPRDYRAAVTLGAGVTKDKLVQACMRMRKLGEGQSVVFCIPQEIRTKVLSIVGGSSEYCIDVSDVLRWAIAETWVEMQRNIPLWAVQGERFERQSSIWRQARADGEIQMSKSQAEGFLEPEAQTLEQRYRPRHKDGLPIMSLGTETKNQNIRLIMERCRKFANIEFRSTQLQEEQERQRARETEQERQVQRPPSAKPGKHSIHRDLRLFVDTGTLNRSSVAFTPAFQTLRNTSAAQYLKGI
ncbi:hypothetical protein BDW62DRAFT_200299 [Aspergillus aurantiobrunneus]